MKVETWIHSRAECKKRGIETNGRGGFWLNESLVVKAIDAALKDQEVQKGLKAMLDNAGKEQK